ncbi:hypothetical protein CEE44_04500 [Candidatus Woesearchaeota archaeon B3_Woes]|nr:MAG: hypothetical protein CEE44_04500 [Candidatus Woesearchaeota archaeon B3_Woes]
MNQEYEPEITPRTKMYSRISTITQIVISVVYLGILGVQCYNSDFEDVPVQQEVVAPSQLELKTDSLHMPLDNLYIPSRSDATFVE